MNLLATLLKKRLENGKWTKNLKTYSVSSSAREEAQPLLTEAPSTADIIVISDRWDNLSTLCVLWAFFRYYFFSTYFISWCNEYQREQLTYSRPNYQVGNIFCNKNWFWRPRIIKPSKLKMRIIIISSSYLFWRP